MYPLLRTGDRLATVAIVQILINRNMLKGTYIAVDGIFGRNTRKAVISFQISRGLGRDGIVGKNTWRELIRDENLQVIDSVDLTNFKDIGYEDEAIRNAGGSPLVNYGMCNGVKVAMAKIQERARYGNIVLLRFHGHGSPGDMGVSVGTGDHVSSQFGTTFLDAMVRYLSQFASMFSALGSAELHGCRVGAGREGRQLVRGLANAWNVPVTAGIRTQYGGGLSTFRFEGPVVRAFPGRHNLKSWAQSLPASEIFGMSVDR